MIFQVKIRIIIQIILSENIDLIQEIFSQRLPLSHKRLFFKTSLANSNVRMYENQRQQNWVQKYLFSLFIKSIYMNQHRADYINHQLNKSMSKTSYSFGKSQRFPNYEQERGQSTPYEWGQKYQSRKPTSPFKVNIYRDHILNGQIRRQRYPEGYYEGRSKSRSPGKVYLSRSPSNKLKNEYSPTKKIHKETSPNKVYRQHGHVYYRGSYYPVGIQINKQGKYVVSNYENVKSPGFGKYSGTDSYKNLSQTYLGPGQYDVGNKSPGKYVESKSRSYAGYSFSKSPRKGLENTAFDKNFGPGMYDSFSQFGRGT